MSSWLQVHGNLKMQCKRLHTVRTAPVVLSWLLINSFQIYSVYTVANEGKETNEQNAAKHKQCQLWNVVWPSSILIKANVCVNIYACVLACAGRASAVVCWNGDGSCWIFMSPVLGWGQEIRCLCFGRRRETVCVWETGAVGGGGNGRGKDVSTSVA